MNKSRKHECLTCHVKYTVTVRTDPELRPMTAPEEAWLEDSVFCPACASNDVMEQV